MSALIDRSGRGHLAVDCDAKIHYSAQVGAIWETAAFAPPTKREEHDPELALDGDVLYLAYTRISVEEGGCGDSGLRDVGVFVRTRVLPSGAWSAPKQIGATADHVQSLRVIDGTIYATVSNETDDRRYFETLDGDVFRRYEIPNATGEVALRIGDDGRARVAYEAAGWLWYGTFTDGKVSAVKVPGSDRGYRPVLVLGAGDRPYLVWNRGWHGAGCTQPDPLPDDGTYFSTTIGGRLQSERLTSSEAQSSLALDVGADRVHAVVYDRKAWVYLTKSGTGSWSRQSLAELHPQDPVIRVDPRTGAVLVAFVDWADDVSRVFVATHE